MLVSIVLVTTATLQRRRGASATSTDEMDRSRCLSGWMARGLSCRGIAAWTLLFPMASKCARTVAASAALDRRIRSEGVRLQLERLIGIHGAPEHIRSDNGSEFIHCELQEWLK